MVEEFLGKFSGFKTEFVGITTYIKLPKALTVLCQKVVTNGVDRIVYGYSLRNLYFVGAYIR